MCDTNWCTFCDCAVSLHSDSVYCSEECFQGDAPLADIGLFRKPALSWSTCKRSNRINEEVSMYSDSIHRPLTDKFLLQSVPSPPMLTSSISPPNTHDVLALGTPVNVSSGSPICEKMDFLTPLTSFNSNGVPQQTRV